MKLTLRYKEGTEKEKENERRPTPPLFHNSAQLRGGREKEEGKVSGNASPMNYSFKKMFLGEIV